MKDKLTEREGNRRMEGEEKEKMGSQLSAKRKGCREIIKTTGEEHWEEVKEDDGNVAFTLKFQ